MAITFVGGDSVEQGFNTGDLSFTSPGALAEDDYFVAWNVTQSTTSIGWTPPFSGTTIITLVHATVSHRMYIFHGPLPLANVGDPTFDWTPSVAEYHTGGIAFFRGVKTDFPQFERNEDSIQVTTSGGGTTTVTCPSITPTICEADEGCMILRITGDTWSTGTGSACGTATTPGAHTKRAAVEGQVHRCMSTLEQDAVHLSGPSGTQAVGWTGMTGSRLRNFHMVSVALGAAPAVTAVEFMARHHLSRRRLN